MPPGALSGSTRCKTAVATGSGMMVAGCRTMEGSVGAGLSEPMVEAEEARIGSMKAEAEEAIGGMKAEAEEARIGGMKTLAAEAMAAAEPEGKRWCQEQ